MWYEFLALLGVASFLFYRWMTRNNDHFEKRGIPYKKPTFFLGAFWELLFKKKTIFDIVKDIYREHNGQ